MEGTTVGNLPRRIGRFDIAARVAGGGSPIDSEVFVGTDSLRGNGKAVVVKRLAATLAKDAAKVGAYMAAAQDVARRLHHPNLVEIRTVGAEGNDVFLVMDYIEGETLARFVRELHKTGQALPSAIAAYIIAEACAGLDAAHRAGFVHGLLTPYDVFIGYDGKIRVLDTGIAAAKVAAAADGDIVQVREIEVQYSSPEVCRGQTADRRSDVFSLGAMLWELLTGVSPFERAERAATIRAICDEVIASPDSLRRHGDLPGRLSATTMEALERDPAKRCSDAAKLRQLLLGHVGADKPARNELARLMTTTFEKRKTDKGTLLAKVSNKAPASELMGLDVNDETTGLEPLVHGADLDAKIPSGISAPTGGAVTDGPKVVVHRPQSDPSMRTTHPTRERKGTAPLGPMLSPMLSPEPAAPHPATSEPESTPSGKPPRVPFYADDTEARRQRQEPTSVIVRPKQTDSMRVEASPEATPKRKKPLAIILAVTGGFAITLTIVLALRGIKTPEVSAKTSTTTSVAASTPAPSIIASTAPTETSEAPSAAASATASATAPASASATTSANEKTVLTIDTVPTHATVVLNGKKVGTTPIDLKVPKSADEVTIELSHAGYATMKERVTPDVNQRMKLNLVPAKTTAPGGKPPSSSNPYKKFE